MLDQPGPSPSDGGPRRELAAAPGPAIYV